MLLFCNMFKPKQNLILKRLLNLRLSVTLNRNIQKRKRSWKICSRWNPILHFNSIDEKLKIKKLFNDKNYLNIDWREEDLVSVKLFFLQLFDFCLKLTNPGRPLDQLHLVIGNLENLLKTKSKSKFNLSILLIFVWKYVETKIKDLCDILFNIVSLFKQKVKMWLTFVQWVWAYKLR